MLKFLTKQFLYGRFYLWLKERIGQILFLTIAIFLIIYFHSEYLDYIEYKSNKALINDNSKFKPKGGYIYIHVAGYTIAAGNTEYWTCIVSDKNGKEISRKTGDYNIPNIPTHKEGDPSGSMWTNLMLERLDSNITDTFNVRVINNLTSVSNSYMIFPNQKVK